MAQSKPILIVGAGLAGCLMAIELARLEYKVVVFEKRPSDDDSSIASRSINLALAPSTLRLLRDSAKLGGELARIATLLEGRVLHPIGGKPIFQPYAKRSDSASLLNPPAGGVSVARAELNALLRAAAEKYPNIEFRFGEKVVACDPERAELGIENAQGRSVSVAGEVIIAADGAMSAIRRLLKLRKPARVREDRTTLRHWYKELVFASTCARRKRALHIWPRAGFLMMALPNCDGSFRGAIFLPRTGRNGFSALKSAVGARRFFEKHFPDAVPAVKDLVEQYSRNPISSLISVRCNPWHVGRTVLIGDACHTLYPFSGQGANLALEDCMHLRRCVEQAAPDWQGAFTAFTELRKRRVDYLCEATRVMSNLVLGAMPQEGILGRV